MNLLIKDYRGFKPTEHPNALFLRNNVTLSDYTIQYEAFAMIALLQAILETVCREEADLRSKLLFYHVDFQFFDDAVFVF